MGSSHAHRMLSISCLQKRVGTDRLITQISLNNMPGGSSMESGTERWFFHLVSGSPIGSLGVGVGCPDPAAVRQDGSVGMDGSWRWPLNFRPSGNKSHPPLALPQSPFLQDGSVAHRMSFGPHWEHQWGNRDRGSEALDPCWRPGA